LRGLLAQAMPFNAAQLEMGSRRKHKQRRGPSGGYLSSTKGSGRQTGRQRHQNTRGDNDGLRVLVGYDFGFGYPAGFAPTFPGPRGPWENLWAYLEQVVTDTETNVNNRFQVAETLNARHRAALFWGVPQPLPALSPRRKQPPQGLSDNPFAAFRVTELAASSQCGKTIKSVWQLYGGVSVGSQVLTGLPYLERLRRQYATQVAVWPQGTGFVDDPLVGRPESMILLVEIWPTAFIPTYVDGAGERDEQQVSWAVRACFRQQATGGMAQWFNPASVRKLAPAEVDVVRQEEGWILCVE